MHWSSRRKIRGSYSKEKLAQEKEKVGEDWINQEVSSKKLDDLVKWERDQN